IWLYSEVERGTTFKVYLPPAERDVESEPVPAVETRVARGSETILLVEDEDAVRTLSRTVLESCGYRVLEARGGEEALDFVRRSEDPIHLLLTDVVMPAIGGADLAV